MSSLADPSRTSAAEPIPGDRPERWCVVGGGMLGMVLAWRLAQRGRTVTLREAAPHLGGLADSWRVGDVEWDRHYHVTLLSDLRLRSVLAELGLAERIRWVETKTGFFIDHRLHPFSTAVDFLRFPPLGLWNKLRFAWSIWHTSRIRDWQRLERMTVEAWLRSCAGNRTFERIWLPLLRAKLGDNYERASAAFIWATVSRLYAARRSGLAREMFGYVSGGYRTTVNALERALVAAGVTIQRNSPVREVASTPPGVAIRGSDGSEVFDRVALTLPSPQLANLVPQWPEAERNRHATMPYQGICCASLVLKRSLSPYYVTNIADDRVPFTGVIEMTSLVDPRELGGRHLVYLPWYVPSDSAAFALDDDEIRRRFWAGLRVIHPTLAEEDLVAFQVSRARYVMPIPTIGFSETVPPRDTSIPGLHVVNSSQIVNGTLNVNEAVKLAEEAAEEWTLPRPSATMPGVGR